LCYVLATANPGKIGEMREILSALGIDYITRDDLSIDIEVEETGSTFLENATLKARAICTASGMPAIADDSGLVVDALGGEPGLYSSSYGGAELTDKERCLYLLKKMKNMEQRQAKFVCTIVCAFPDDTLLTASGECNGTILTNPRGDNGFGYDPVFLPDGKNKTTAELTAVEKNAISHRGAALREFAVILKNHITGKSL
jgi:XTP/dITP diphosphohydrolase